MFAKHYFGNHYYPKRYFPNGAGSAPVIIIGPLLFLASQTTSGGYNQRQEWPTGFGTLQTTSGGYNSGQIEA